MKLTTDRHEASRGFCATAELLVIGAIEENHRSIVIYKLVEAFDDYCLPANKLGHQNSMSKLYSAVIDKKYDMKH